MHDAMVWRSVLFVPAANARAVTKARALAADAVILDLEDAVAPDDKPAARLAAVAAIGAGGWGDRAVLVRVNAMGTPWSDEDFLAARAAGAAAVVVPKVERLADVAEAVRCAGGLPVWAMIETPRGVLAADLIAAVPGVAGLIAGTNDLLASLRVPAAPGRAALAYSLGRIVLAARSGGVAVLDGVFNDIHDAAGFAAEAAQGRALGFDGKTLIHPDQIAPCNAAFAPTAAELDDARGLIAAFEAAGTGVTTWRGLMIEALHVEAARQLLLPLAARGRGEGGAG